MYHKVTWTIDIDAENPLEAAKQALEIMQDKGSEALAFEVFDEKDNKVAEIDLLDESEKKVVFNVRFYNKDGELIDQTQIDEKDEKLAWELFEDFGHKRKNSDWLEFDDTTED